MRNQVESRQYPVTVHFNRKTANDHDFLDEAFNKVCKIHTKLPPGAILVFLTGKREIETLVKKIKQRFAPKKRASKGKQLNSSIDETASIKISETSSSEQIANRKTGVQGHNVDKQMDDNEGNLDDDGVLDMDELDAMADNDDDDYDEDDDKDDKDGGSGDDDDEGENKDEGQDKTAKGAAMKDGDKAPEDPLAAAAAAAEANDKGVDENDGPGPVTVLPLYAMLSPSAQAAVFKPPKDGHRLVSGCFGCDHATLYLIWKIIPPRRFLCSWPRFSFLFCQHLPPLTSP